jgi:two-component system, chemotaxis family, chemotaxis protein CheY
MKRILVVDDSATMRRMVMASLRALKDIKFQEAGNGLEAIEHLALGTIDLILLDLNMPDMHGLEVVKFVRQHAAHRAIPIIVLTTRGDAESRNSALVAGASAFLTKPFDPPDLAKQVSKMLDVPAE